MPQSVTPEQVACFAQKIAPSETKEPINLILSPDWPFSQIVMDLFYVGNHGYLACADKLTGWLILYHLTNGQANASRLISICWDIFQSYAAPEELSSDGRPPFTSIPFTQFLWDWVVKHRLSSTAYPQSNGRAELAVKSAKRIMWQHRSWRVAGQWPCSKSHPPIQEYTHPKYWTITRSTATPPPTTWLYTIPTHTLQATRRLDRCSKKSRDNSNSSECSSYRAI